MILNIKMFTIDKNRNYNAEIEKAVNEELHRYTDSIDALAENSIVKGVLTEDYEATEVNKLLYGFCNNQQIKSNFILLDKSKNIISTNLYKNNEALFLLSNDMKDIISKTENSSQYAHRSISSINYDNGQNSNYVFSKAIKNNNEIMGYIFLDWREDSLNLLINNNDVDITVILDKFDNVIFSTHRMLIDSIGKFKTNNISENIIEVNNKLYYITSKDLYDKDIKIMTMSSVMFQKQLFIFGCLFLFFISLFMIILVLILADKVTTRNMRSMDELLGAVSELKSGNLDYRIEYQTFHEFQTLYSEFNVMVSKVQELVKYNNELADRKRFMEVKHLESQFNPHFLYNVMETLRYEIILDPQRASQMVVAFANLMRYRLNYGSTQVALKTDIEYMKDYLMIQKMRFSNRFEYYLHIDEEILQSKVPKLLIQPIIENSIIHGMEDTEFLTLVITGRALKDNIEIIIEDDGKGIKDDELNILKNIIEEENQSSSHIGLYNVHRTIKLIYGNNYGLDIQSTYLKGTKITIKIPLIEGEAVV